MGRRTSTKYILGRPSSPRPSPAPGQPGAVVGLKGPPRPKGGRHEKALGWGSPGRGRRDWPSRLPYNARMDEGLAFLRCARCSADLTPGKGDFYVVRIEAIADPTPPSFTDEDLRRDTRVEIERLIGQMRDLSEQELLDQVYRRLIVRLCGPCYRVWIEAPVK